MAAFAEQSKLYPLSQAWTTSTLHANQFTAACGVTIYRGDGLPPENKGNAFTCDPTGNLVHRETLVPHGASFVSHPSDHEQEFLASTDNWFRPVNLANGPDGALYIVDMYRAVIEHPDFMPTELKNRKDLHDGSDRGRIWRVKSEESIMPQERPEQPLDKLSTNLLVQLLEHRNAWHRDTAFRLLLERDRDEVIDALKLNWKQNRLTRSRLPILWMIRLLDPRLTPAVLAWSEIDNRDARVREQVVSMIGESLDELLPDDIYSLASEETDDRVRFRLALSLSGRSSDVQSERRALIRLLDRGVEDPWLRVAVGTMKSEPPQALVTEILEHWITLKKPPAGAAELIEELTEIAGAQFDPNTAHPVLVKLLEFVPVDWGSIAADVSSAGVRGLGKGAGRHGLSFAVLRSELSTKELGLLSNLMQSLSQLALKTEIPLPRRLAAIRSLAFGEGLQVESTLLDFAFNRTEIPVRLAAMEALGSLSDQRIGVQVLEAFNAQTPQLRRAMIDLMLTSDSRTALLVTALEHGAIKTSEIDPLKQTVLMKHRNKEISQRAEKLFAVDIAPDRAAVVAKYKAAIENSGNPARGRVVFEKNCINCHRIANIGVNVGPDIGDTRDKLPTYLLTNILDPNRAVDSNYFGYIATTKQGKSYAGLIKSETATSLTIRMPEGKEETMLRSDIADIKSTSMSLMPIGFEKNISIEQMTDLIAFLKNWRYLDGAVPLP